MLKPLDVTLVDMDGVSRSYVVARLPAIQAREVVCNYPLSALPKLGDYKVNEQMMFKLLSFAGVRQDNGEVLMLSTPVLVNNHVPDWETLLKLERAMIEHNVSFFPKGKTFSFSDVLKAALPEILLAIKTSMDSLGPLSKATKRPSKS